MLRAVEIERLCAVKRPAGWVPEGAPARKLRAGTGTGLLTEGKRARLGKGLRASNPRDLEDIIRFAVRFIAVETVTVTCVSTCGCVVRVLVSCRPAVVRAVLRRDNELN